MALDAIEKSVTYYLNFLKRETNENVYRIVIRSPLVKKTEFSHCIPKDTVKKKLLNKLADKDIQQLSQEERYIKLLNAVNDIPA